LPALLVVVGHLVELADLDFPWVYNTFKMASESGTLSETYIQDCFHSYLRSSLAQAKAERLLDVDVLASAEADLMITGPYISLYTVFTRV
jgi:hypothetical protein